MFTKLLPLKSELIVNVISTLEVDIAATNGIVRFKFAMDPDCVQSASFKLNPVGI